MEYVRIIGKPRRVETLGRVFAVKDRLKSYNMAMAFSSCLPDEEKDVNRAGAKSWIDYIKTWFSILPTGQKEVMTRHFIDGVTVDEIATVEKVSRLRVQNYIYRACMLLFDEGFLSGKDPFFDDDELLARG